MSNKAKVAEFQKDRDDLPRGQQLLRAGMRIIDEDEMQKILQFDILHRAEAERRRDEMIERVLSETDFERDRLRVKFAHRTDGWRDYYVINISVKRFGLFPVDLEWDTVPHPSLRYIPLESYARKVMPDHVLDSIVQAKKFGAKNKDFYVVEPTFKSPDPIVVALLYTTDDGEEGDFDCLYVSHWGNNDD